LGANAKGDERGQMREDKTCNLCGITYRGDGYKDVCTIDCFYKGEYAKRHGRTIEKKKLYEKKIPKEDPIKKANERWLKEKKMSNTPKETRRINDLLNSKHTRPCEWSGKQYRAIRG
jgi:hypothetical protein